MGMLLRSLGVRIFFIIVIIVLDNKSYKCLANETEYIDEQLHNDDVDKRDYLRVMRGSNSNNDVDKRDYLRVMRSSPSKKDFLRVMRKSDPDVKRDYLRVMKKDYLRVMRNAPQGKRDYLRVMRRTDPDKRDYLRVMRASPDKKDYLRVMRSDPDDQWLSYDESPQEDSELGGSPLML